MIKKCKNCNKETEEDLSYCSKNCSKEYVKRTGLGRKSIKLCCLTCQQVYFKPPSLAKNSRFCSRVCANRFFARCSKKERLEQKCLHCFCSLDDVEKSKRKSLKRKYCSLECFSKSQRSNRENFVCEICSKSFESLSSKPKRFCSRGCQYKGQSCGLIKIPTNGRSGVRIDLPSTMRFKSSLEADYARYCNFLGIKFEYEKKTFEIIGSNGKTRRYTPDFYLPEQDLYVETKALRNDKKFESNLSALSAIQALGYNTKTVFMTEFYNELKENGIYDKIENLEHRDYKGTKFLVRDN